MSGRQEVSGTVAYEGRENALNDVCPEDDCVHGAYKHAGTPAQYACSSENVWSP